MERYKDLSGQSGVESFEIAERSIRVRFKTGQIYLYSYERPGRLQTEKMKRLAKRGRGLSTYISREVRDKYEDKE